MNPLASPRGAIVVAIAAICLSACRPLAAEEKEPSVMAAIDLTLVDPEAIAYATFQSHNQKVVSNRNGIFLTYLVESNQDYTAQRWRLCRSTDGGKTFATVHEATHATNPPAIETDAEGNVYLVRPDFLAGCSYLCRFTDFAKGSEPVVSQIPNSSHGKYAMFLDPRRKRLYYFCADNRFCATDLYGTVLFTHILLAPGPQAALQYPHLALGRDGTLYAAWTTQKHGVYLYWDIHAIRSVDGGQTWQRLNGAPLELPVTADQTGPADMISHTDEFDVHSWLSALLAKDGKVHFVYWAENTPQRQRYARYDAATGAMEAEIEPIFRDRPAFQPNDSGLLASRAAEAGSPLYFVSTVDDRGRLACLASDDNGSTWYEYAVSDRAFAHRVYSIGGARELTAAGCIVGTFTDVAADAKKLYDPKSGSVYFFRIQAGLSSAAVRGARFEAGTLTVEFGPTRGQPREIRFQQGDGAWSAWQPMATKVAAKLPAMPARFQLKSGLGVVSQPVSLPQ